MISEKLLEELKAITKLGEEYNKRLIEVTFNNKDINLYKEMLNAKHNYEKKKETLGKEIGNYKYLTNKERDEIEFLFLS